MSLYSFLLMLFVMILPLTWFPAMIVAETSTESVKSLQSSARKDAEKDAISKANRMSWLGTGSAIAVGGAIVGAIIGFVGGTIVNPEDAGGGIMILPNNEQASGAGIGAIIGIIAPLVGINYTNVKIPSQKLVGKSPEYVLAYTEAYKKKARSERNKMTIVGAVGTCLAIGIYIAVGAN